MIKDWITKEEMLKAVEGALNSKILTPEEKMPVMIAQLTMVMVDIRDVLRSTQKDLVEEPVKIESTEIAPGTGKL